MEIHSSPQIYFFFHVMCIILFFICFDFSNFKIFYLFLLYFSSFLSSFIFVRQSCRILLFRNCLKSISHFVVVSTTNLFYLQYLQLKWSILFFFQLANFLFCGNSYFFSCVIVVCINNSKSMKDTYCASILYYFFHCKSTHFRIPTLHFVL